MTCLEMIAPVAALGVAATLMTAPVRADEAPAADLDDRIRALEAELAGLNGDWLTEQRADEIRSLVHDVLADADTRASLLQSSMTGGYDKGFFLGSADGSFLLRMAGQIQVRFAYNHQDSGSADSHRWGFENRRTKLKFKGHVSDPSWTYEINGAFSRSTGAFSLEDGLIGKDLGDGWKVRMGQFKGPFLREELVSSSKQLLVERSLINEEFNQDRAQGVELSHREDNFKFAAMVSDGFGTPNTAALAEDTEIAFAARIDWLQSGTWGQFGDLTSWQDDEFGFLLGGAVHYQKGEYGSATVGEEQTFSWTVDGSMEFGGANLFASIVGRHLDLADADQYGIVVQGGVFIVPDAWEAFARYEHGDFDSGGIEQLDVLTLGVNRYWKKHNVKWTSDVGYAFDQVDPVWASGGANWRGDPVTDDGQLVLRTQLQLLF